MAAEKIDLVKMFLDWGWAAAGTLAAGLGSVVVGRISKLEKAVETKAPLQDLKDLSTKHETLREDMHTLFREQNELLTKRHDELRNLLITRL